MNHFLKVLVIFSLASCAVSKTKLSDDGKKVKIITHSEGCSALGKVVGVNEEGIEELAHNHARNLAARMGADSVMLETVGNGNMIRSNGVAYQCGK